MKKDVEQGFYKTIWQKEKDVFKVEKKHNYYSSCSGKILSLKI